MNKQNSPDGKINQAELIKRHETEEPDVSGGLRFTAWFHLKGKLKVGNNFNMLDLVPIYLLCLVFLKSAQKRKKVSIDPNFHQLRSSKLSVMQ